MNFEFIIYTKNMEELIKLGIVKLKKEDIVTDHDSINEILYLGIQAFKIIDKGIENNNNG